MEGKNILIESLGADNILERGRAQAEELVRLKVDVIVTAGIRYNPPGQGSNFYDSYCHGE